MNFVFFYHSLVSDWNHGNAHFLRGVVTELIDRGHAVQVFEPLGGWSVTHLRRECGAAAMDAFNAAYPRLRSSFYDPATIDLDMALDAADIVIVHEWNDAELVGRIGRHRARGRSYRLLFHNTHHRAVSAPEALRACDLSNYDGVLAFGEVLRRHYERHGWARRAWTWHEAADIEALACRIPLVSAPWEDTEGLLEPGRDFLTARNGEEMREGLRRLQCDPAFAQEIADHGYRTLLTRHTCVRRVEELLGICRELQAGEGPPRPVALAG